MKAFRKVREEVKDPPILLDVVFRVGFKSMDHIWKLHAITYKEDGKVVSNKIKVTLFHKAKLGIMYDTKVLLLPYFLLLKLYGISDTQLAPQLQ